MGQISDIEIINPQSLPSNNDPKDAFFLAYKTISGKLETVRINWENIISLFNVVQTTGESSTDVMSQKAVYDAFRNDIFLATDTNNGLMSKEQVAQLKELEDMFKTDEDNFDFVLTAFTDTDANPQYIGSHSIHYDSTGSANYKIASKNSSYESVAKNANQYVRLISSSRNDIIDLYVSNVYKISVTPSENIRLVRLSSKNLKRLDQFVISDTKFEGIDLSGMYDLRSLTGINCSLTSFGGLSTIMLSSINLSNSKKLETMNVWAHNLVTIIVANCSALVGLYFDSDLGSLKTVDISGTLLNLSFVTTLASRWDSRSGKDTGVLKLDTALYNQMSSELRTTFTNKNITFDVK